MKWLNNVLMHLGAATVTLLAIIGMGWACEQSWGKWPPMLLTSFVVWGFCLWLIDKGRD